jgi:ABC-type lipoprotein export system ATPase subunit
MSDTATRGVDRPTGGATRPAIVCENLVKIYKVDDLEAIALQGLDLVVAPGEFVAIVGASGSGKSTLLSILGGLDIPSAGAASVGGFDLLQMTAAERTKYRRDVVGFVTQQTSKNLIPYLTAIENVEVPLRLAGHPARFRKMMARNLLEQVGLADRLDHRPRELSGGEQQRVAIAVAVANQPQVVLADEPTGELDSATAAEVIDVFRSLADDHGVTVIVVTHDQELSARVDRTVSIRDGRTSTEVVRRTVSDVDGDTRVVDEEFAVLDRVGRLQLPAEYVDALALEQRVRLALQPDRINVFPDRASGHRTLSDDALPDGTDQPATPEVSDQEWRRE